MWSGTALTEKTHRIFTLARSDAVLEAALFVCIVGLTWGGGGVHKLLLGRDVVQTGAHTGAEAHQTEKTCFSFIETLNRQQIIKCKWMLLLPRPVCASTASLTIKNGTLWHPSELFLFGNLQLPNDLCCCRYLIGWLTPGSWWCNPGCRPTRWTGSSS